MAKGEHMIQLGEGDTVLMASSLIPGNETSIYRVINGLTRLGASVVHQGNAQVHVSGHASAGELVYCYNIVRPRHVMPIHGEWRHLKANAELAIRTGVDPKRVLIGYDGVVVDLVDGEAEIVGEVPASHVYVDGTTVGVVNEHSLRDRRILSQQGVVTVIALVDPDTGKLTEEPDFITRGFMEHFDFDGAISAVQKSLAEDRKSTRLNSSHVAISYAVFCLKKKQPCHI